MPEQKLDRPRPPVEDVVVGARHVGEVVPDPGGRPRARDPHDRVMEVVLVARHEAQPHTGTPGPRPLRERGPLSVLAFAEGGLDSPHCTEGVGARQSDAQGSGATERDAVDPRGDVYKRQPPGRVL